MEARVLEKQQGFIQQNYHQQSNIYCSHSVLRLCVPNEVRLNDSQNITQGLPAAEKGVSSTQILAFN
mgnify:CR=1 FL=1